MNLPWAVWCALATGLLGSLLNHRIRSVALGRLCAVLVWTTWLFALAANSSWPLPAWDSFAFAGMTLALLWSASALFYCRPAIDPSIWLSVGGLGAIACGADWVTLGLGWELVRFSRESCRTPTATGPSLAFWTAVVLWLFTTGSLELSDVSEILQHSYAAQEPELSLGRPSLLVAAAACLTIISLVAPCFSSVRQTESERQPAFDARMLAAPLLLARLCGDVFLGVEQPATWVLLVLAAVAWFVPVQMIAASSQLDRLLKACALWQVGICLSWVLLVVIERGSHAGGLPTAPGLDFSRIGLLAELLHALFVILGLTSAQSSFAREGKPPRFLEELRGAGRERPVQAALLIVPLASLLGVPGTWGSVQRLFLVAGFWTLPQSGPNDMLSPHAGLVALQLTCLITWLLLVRTLWTIMRTLYWEPAVTNWQGRRNVFPLLLSTLCAAALLSVGLWMPWLLP